MSSLLLGQHVVPWNEKLPWDRLLCVSSRASWTSFSLWSTWLESCSSSTWSLGQHPYFYRQLDCEMFKSENSDKMTTKTSMLTMPSNHCQNHFRSKLFIIINKLSVLIVAWTACGALKWGTTLIQTSMCLIKSIMDELQSLEHVTRTLVQHPSDLWANIFL